MAGKIVKVEPEEFRKLTHNKKVDLLAKLFFMTCSTKKLFQNGRLNPEYFAIRKFFLTKSVEQIHALYDFIYSLNKQDIMDLSNFFKRAEEHRKKLISLDSKRKIAKMKIEQYKDYSVKDVLNF